MRKIFLILALCLSANFCPIHAQGFLKNLKEKAEKTAKEAGKSLKAATSLPTQSNSTDSRAKGTDGKNATATSDSPKTPQFLQGQHQGSIDESNHPTFESPKITASTAHVTVEKETRDISDFHDGAAYIYSYPSGAFFIDKNGRKLFDTGMTENVTEKMPRFNQGVFMEIIKNTGKNAIRIRDKKGTAVKEFPKAVEASQFKDGKAIIVESAGFMSPKEVKYVDTKGNYIYPELTFKGSSVYPPFMSVEDLNRESSEGVTAFCMLVDNKDTFKWGFHDPTGKIVITPQFDAVGDFHDGLAAIAVIENGIVKWGFIDKTGRTVIAPKFTNRPSDFNSGYSRVIDKEEQGYYMDKQGKFVVGPVNKYPANEKEGNYVYISPFHNGYAVVGYEAKEPEYGTFRTYYSPIDANFNKCGYAQLTNHLSMTRPEFIYHEGNYYVLQNYGGSDRWVRFNPRNFDRIGQPSRHIYSDGLRLHISTNAGYPSGFVNENGEFAIVIEESKF